VGMNTAVKITLFLFLFFLITPTVVSAFEEDADVSYAYNLGEEENDNLLEAVNTQLHNSIVDFMHKAVKKLKITSYNLRLHKRVCGDIFIPPPELI
jgi:hypothetical protein